MKREEFLSSLRLKLKDLPLKEIESAINYYDEIFLDAGKQKEDEIAEKLGGVDFVARQIFIENGIDPDKKQGSMIEDVNRNNNFIDKKESENENIGSRKSGSRTFIGILILIILSPLIVILFVMISALCIIVLSIEISFIAAGLSLIVSGIYTTFSIPPLGLCILAIGLILTGIFGLTAGLIKFPFRFIGNFYSFIISKFNKFIYVKEV